MIKYVFFLICILFCKLALAQNSSTFTKTTNDAWTDKITFGIGLGLGNIKGDVYQNLNVNKSDNSVLIEKDNNRRTNISLGIIYSFWSYIYTGDNDKKTYYSAGPSIAAFFNPIDIGSSNLTKASQLDFGFAAGWKFKQAAIYLSIDFFRLRQPKDYFLKRFDTNDKSYVIDGEIQKSIDVNDDSIYWSKSYSAVGVKLVFPITVFKSYSKATD